MFQKHMLPVVTCVSLDTTYRWYEFSLTLLIFPILQYWDIKCKTASILFYDAIGFRQQLSTTSFDAFELEIAVNYPVHTREWQFHAKSRELIDAFWLVLLSTKLFTVTPWMRSAAAWQTKNTTAKQNKTTNYYVRDRYVPSYKISRRLVSRSPIISNRTDVHCE